VSTFLAVLCYWLSHAGHDSMDGRLAGQTVSGQGHLVFSLHVAPALLVLFFCIYSILLFFCVPSSSLFAAYPHCFTFTLSCARAHPRFL
jgi:hypothetical protein